jgi:antirestriction protein ArdC
MTSTPTPHTAQWAELLHKAVTEPGVISEAFSRFHGYSIGNQMLALVQCRQRGIQPGPLATFPRWKDLGRHVRKGQRALTLCMPVTLKASAPKDAQQGDNEGEQFTFTRFVYKNHWFVLSQTEGAEYTPAPLPGWDADRALESLKIRRVPFTMMDGNVQGYARNREVALNPVADQAACTLFHEVAHIVLGHTAENTLNSDSRDRTPRDIRELEAECVALLCCESLGLPGAVESRGYIQSWYRGHEVPERSAQRIFHAADQILKAGRPS